MVTAMMSSYFQEGSLLKNLLFLLALTYRILSYSCDLLELMEPVKSHTPKDTNKNNKARNSKKNMMRNPITNHSQLFRRNKLKTGPKKEITGPCSSLVIQRYCL